MGRWDALNPDEAKQGSRHPTPHTVRSHHNAIAIPIKTRQNVNSRWGGHIGMTGESRCISVWAFVLQQQLECYKKNEPSFKTSRVESTLIEISESPKEKHIGLSLVAVVRLLEIQNQRIHKLALGVIFDHANDDLAKGDAVECVETCARLGMLHPRSSEIMQCLGCLTAGQAKHLPAEETSERVVGSILIPYLDGTTSNDDSAKVSICKSVQQLLQHPHFSSAILAPLVQDVTDNGREEAIRNPIRLQLFRSLQKKLFTETLWEELRASACSLLTKSIERMQKMNRSKPNEDISELDMAKLESFLAEHLRHSSPLFHQSSRLLNALLQVYPITKLGTRLLFSDVAITIRQESQESRVCPSCGCRQTQFNPFLSSVHASLGNSFSKLGMDCVTELVIALPLELWMKQPASPRGPASGFFRKVVEALVNVLTIARCAVLRERVNIDAIGNLCKTVLQRIPWYNDLVVKAGEDLWESLVVALDCGNLAYKKQVTEILIQSLGGKVTPQGNLTTMIPPARQWLSQEAKAFPFLQGLLTAIQREKSLVKRQVFWAVLRSHPESVILCWDSFIELTEQTGTSGTNQQQIFVALFEALLLGRKDFPSDKIQGLSSTISKHFFNMAVCLQVEVDVTIRYGLLRCYTALTTEDWSFLEKNPTLLANHVEGLLGCFSDTNADIRRTSCKAIGEFCALYLDSSRLSRNEKMSAISTLVQRIVTALGDRLKAERDVSTQAMVIHALGNLALTLIKNGGLRVMENSSAESITTDILLLTDSSDDKVVGNAIRSIGHLGNILMVFGKYHVLVNIVNALSFRVARSVAIASHDELSTMTWKERSSSTKHGWGACHSLGRIFNAVTDDIPVMTDGFRHGVEQLIFCILRAETLSDKVVLAAMAALCELKPFFLVNIVGKTGMLGEALAGVCILVFRELSSPKFINQGDLLLSHLLLGATSIDAAVVLRNEEVSRPMLDSLYHWMVDKEMEGHAFEIFEVALKCLSLNSRNDVSLEQRFASRALMQDKKRQATLIACEREHEGEDEL